MVNFQYLICCWYNCFQCNYYNWASFDPNLFSFVLYTICCQFLWFVPFWLSLRYSLTAFVLSTDFVAYYFMMAVIWSRRDLTFWNNRTQSQFPISIGTHIVVILVKCLILCILMPCTISAVYYTYCCRQSL